MKVQRESMDVIEVSRTGSIVFGIFVGAIIVLFCLSLMFHSSLIFGTPVFWWPTVLLIAVLLILGILIIGAVIYGNTRKKQKR
jgi:NADH:ubiquinone oxidoreductase subunit 6 (subunit J)